MMKIDMERGNISRAEIRGTTEEIFADICYLIGYVYWCVHRQNDNAGESFKRAFVHGMKDDEFIETLFDSDNEDYGRASPLDYDYIKDHEDELRDSGFDVDAIKSAIKHNEMVDLLEDIRRVIESDED